MFCRTVSFCSQAVWGTYATSLGQVATPDSSMVSPMSDKSRDVLPEPVGPVTTFNADSVNATLIFCSLKAATGVLRNVALWNAGGPCGLRLISTAESKNRSRRRSDSRLVEALRTIFDTQRHWLRSISIIDNAVNALGASRLLFVRRTTAENEMSRLIIGNRSPANEIIAAVKLRFHTRLCSTWRRTSTSFSIAGSHPKYLSVRIEPRYSVILDILASVACITLLWMRDTRRDARVGKGERRNKVATPNKEGHPSKRYK